MVTVIGVIDVSGDVFVLAFVVVGVGFGFRFRCLLCLQCSFQLLFQQSSLLSPIAFNVMCVCLLSLLFRFGLFCFFIGPVIKLLLFFIFEGEIVIIVIGIIF